ncbi:hypothetical protein RvY_16257 [Ramazzottius varieornatus]|uniref:G-protein coupled receptors family 1 profile domain-containing protein n=1 Tax=Ramazzottius varieornatus TaxID=947166 RepID=A0A1D1VZ58_RAMVA|nr:hypothetical protein RvY_16257 [Ramazzottius varieornatus]
MVSAMLSNSSIIVNFSTQSANLSSNVSGVSSDRPDEGAAWWLMLLVILVVFITVTANFAVMLAFLMEPKLGTPFNFLVLNMTVADFLDGVPDTPLTITGYTYFGYWPYSVVLQ